MLNLSLTTIALQALNFLVLVIALYFLLYRPMQERIREREEEREQAAQELTEQREEVEQLRRELNQQLEEAEEEADRIIARARERAEQQQEHILHEAEEEVERILTEAHADANRFRRQAVEDFHEELLDAILGISGRMIRRVAPSEVHDTLVEQLNERIWEMGRSEIERVEAFRLSLGERAPTAYVTSASNLTPEQQGELARTLTALADRHVNLELRTDPDLYAGLRVRLEDIVVDNSIAGQLEELEEEAEEALEEQLEVEPSQAEGANE
jgi:F-type H+-transporting ATPase subunit b